ncbi:peptidase associated/transthyretin-like domain-containing protein [Polaribacter atrinae]|uniref:hypothetical protein n=1 Tax=Polaribacter atrinae TaxID=1333662 RepID=UPI000837CB6C|nr:hypothetical protein [Polaribacter atrinae]
MEKKLLTIFLFIITLPSLSQNNGTLISSRVLDSLGIVKNANIINLNTNQGTFSSDSGKFEIYASKGDTLRVSSIQHITQKIKITKEIIAHKALIVVLKPNTYVLDEFELKRHNLVGKLAVDVKNIPTDEKFALLKSNMDFSNVDFSIKDHRIDANDIAKSKVVNTVANSYSGIDAAGLIGGLFSSKKFEKSRLLDEKLDRKKAFGNKILLELGEDFFFEKLKIPKEKYYHFLDYCDYLDLDKIYNENKVLKLIEIFQKESIPYLEIIKEE